MEPTQTFILNQDFQAEKFDNEILLYAISSGNGVYLNETAYLIWEMSGQGHSLGKMITLLEEAFPEQQGAIAADVFSAVESMLANGILLCS